MRGTKREVRDGVWLCRVYVGTSPSGKPIQKGKTVHGSARAADQALRQMVIDLEAGTLPVGTESVSDLMAKWLELCETTKGLSPTTLREHRRIVKTNIKPVIGDIRLSKLKASDLDSLYGAMVARGVKATTVRRTHAVIGAALKQGCKWDLLDRNVALLASPPAVHQPEIVAPSPAEVRALIAVAEVVEPQFGALLTLTALTGARRGEVCGLQWSDVDFEASTLTIRRSVHEVAGGGFGVKSTKTHAVRTNTLDPVAYKALKDHRARVEAQADQLGLTIGADAFIFSQSPAGSEPLHPDFVSRFVSRMSEQAGLDIHLHSLRHYAITQSFGAGFDEVTVAGRHGHKDPSVTQDVYGHLLKQRERELASALGSVLRPNN
jgi:integrase